LNGYPDPQHNNALQLTARQRASQAIFFSLNADRAPQLKAIVGRLRRESIREMELNKVSR
jgi:hypothetical protein